jgi:hypothetical protein
MDSQDEERVRWNTKAAQLVVFDHSTLRPRGRRRSSATRKMTMSPTLGALGISLTMSMS